MKFTGEAKLSPTDCCAVEPAGRSSLWPHGSIAHFQPPREGPTALLKTTLGLRSVQRGALVGGWGLCCCSSPKPLALHLISNCKQLGEESSITLIFIFLSVYPVPLPLEQTGLLGNGSRREYEAPSLLCTLPDATPSPADPHQAPISFKDTMLIFHWAPTTQVSLDGQT